MVATLSKMTEEEFMNLPDDGRKYELVNGEVKEVPAGVRHDEYGMHIGVMLHPYTRGRGALCGSQAGFRMTNSNIRCPDVSFTRKEHFLDGKSPEGFGDRAPDLCIEVISPSEEREEIARKVREYFEAGAEQVWHLFPATQTVRIFTLPFDGTDYTSQQEIDGGTLLPGFRCKVSDLFSLE